MASGDTLSNGSRQLIYTFTYVLFVFTHLQQLRVNSVCCYLFLFMQCDLFPIINPFDLNSSISNSSRFVYKVFITLCLFSSAVIQFPMKSTVKSIGYHLFQLQITVNIRICGGEGFHNVPDFLGYNNIHACVFVVSPLSSAAVLLSSPCVSCGSKRSGPPQYSRQNC